VWRKATSKAGRGRRVRGGGCSPSIGGVGWRARSSPAVKGGFGGCRVGGRPRRATGLPSTSAASQELQRPARGRRQARPRGWRGCVQGGDGGAVGIPPFEPLARAGGAEGAPEGALGNRRACPPGHGSSRHAGCLHQPPPATTRHHPPPPVGGRRASPPAASTARRCSVLTAGGERPPVGAPPPTGVSGCRSGRRGLRLRALAAVNREGRPRGEVGRGQHAGGLATRNPHRHPAAAAFHGRRTCARLTLGVCGRGALLKRATRTARQLPTRHW